MNIASAKARLALLATISLLFVAFAAWAVAPDESIKASFDREFEIRIDQKAEVPESGFSITFVALLEDSRCPGDVNCIWAGKADIEVTVRSKKTPPQTIVLSTMGEDNQEQKVDIYTIRLVKLLPYPRNDRPSKKSDYVATLLVKKG